MTRVTQTIRLHAPVMEARVSTKTLGEVALALDSERSRRDYERGLAEGAAQRIATVASALESAVNQIDAAREQAASELADFAIELSVGIARRIIQREIAAQDYDLEQLVRGALADSGVGRGNCVVHLHPKDRAALEDVPFRSGTALEADPDVARGDVHVTTPKGLLVREVDAILADIECALKGDRT